MVGYPLRARKPDVGGRAHLEAAYAARSGATMPPNGQWNEELALTVVDWRCQWYRRLYRRNRTGWDHQCRAGRPMPAREREAPPEVANGPALRSRGGPAGSNVASPGFGRAAGPWTCGAMQTMRTVITREPGHDQVDWLQMNRSSGVDPAGQRNRTARDTIRM